MADAEYFYHHNSLVIFEGPLQPYLETILNKPTLKALAEQFYYYFPIVRVLFSLLAVFAEFTTSMSLPQNNENPNSKI